MSDLLMPIVIASVTVLFGVLVFTFQFVIQKFSLEPVLAQKAVIERIAYWSIDYAGLYSSGKPNPTDSLARNHRQRVLKASQDLRDLVLELRVRTRSISFYGFWCKLRVISVAREDALEAATSLWGLSVGLQTDFDHEEAVRNNTTVREALARLGLPGILDPGLSCDSQEVEQGEAEGTIYYDS